MTDEERLMQCVTCKHIDTCEEDNDDQEGSCREYEEETDSFMRVNLENLWRFNNDGK